LERREIMSEQNGAEPHGWMNTETLKTRVGEFELKNGYPTDDTAQRLRDLQTVNRANEVYLTQIMRMGETAIPELEHRAFVLQANAQDLRLQHDEIIAAWKARAEREGLDILIAERQRLEMIAWVCDPLPAGIRTAGP
jgi:hypothetical protein